MPLWSRRQAPGIVRLALANNFEFSLKPVIHCVPVASPSTQEEVIGTKTDFVFKDWFYGPVAHDDWVPHRVHLNARYVRSNFRTAPSGDHPKGLITTPQSASGLGRDSRRAHTLAVAVSRLSTVEYLSSHRIPSILPGCNRGVDQKATTVKAVACSACRGTGSPALSGVEGPRPAIPSSRSGSILPEARPSSLGMHLPAGSVVSGLASRAVARQPGKCRRLSVRF